MNRPQTFLTRREVFCAAHRLHSHKLSEKDNLKLYGKCNNPNGHGHNYIVEVTVKGPVDEVSGFIIDVSTLKELIWIRALAKLDHKNLDLDVEFFNDKPSTVENIAAFIWNCLESYIPDPGKLYEITVHETEKNRATLRAS